MDAGRTTRKFPGYTTAELKEFVAKAGDAANPVMVKEITDREGGISRPHVVPQIKGGLVVPRLGRM